MHKYIFLLIPFLLSSCATLQEPTHQQLSSGDYEYLKEYMTWFINHEMRENNVVGLSIALIDGQKTVWSHGFGFADRESNTRASETTKYRAGSISKVFTAMAILQLAEQGELEIDKPLKKYLPEFKIKSRFGSTDNITLKNIMTHHSGLPGEYMDGFAGETPGSFSLLASQMGDYYTAYPANTVLSYSNLAYALAGNVVENISGQSYRNYMQNMLVNLGMHNSDFSGKISGQLAAKGYIDDEIVYDFPIRDIPAGGLNTNVLDLSRLVKMINANGQTNGYQILQSKTLQSMMSPQNENITLDLGKKIGLSWFFPNNYFGKNYKVIAHSGEILAHNSLVVIAPDLKLGVVLLSNSPGDNEILDKIAKKILRQAFHIKKGFAYNEPKKSYTPLHSNSFPDFSGQYASVLGLIEIVGNPENYVVNVLGEQLSLLRNKNNLYSLEYKLFGLIPIDLGNIGKIELFPQLVNGRQLIIGKTQGDKFILAEKIYPRKNESHWDKRLGKYDAINPSEIKAFRVNSLMLKYEKGLYLAEIELENGDIGVYPIKPLTDKEAIVLGIGRDLGETVQIRIINNEEAIDYSGLLFKLNRNI